MRRMLSLVLAILVCGAVVWAADVLPPVVPTPNAARIAELEKARLDVTTEIARLTILQHQLEGGIAELQRLDALAAEKKPAQPKPQTKTAAPQKK